MRTERVELVRQRPMSFGVDYGDVLLLKLVVVVYADMRVRQTIVPGGGVDRNQRTPVLMYRLLRIMRRYAVPVLLCRVIATGKVYREAVHR